MLTNWNPTGEEFKKQVDENIKFLYNDHIKNVDEKASS